ncbi:GNAT family N-acetyltransferase [Breznakiella homolactica]|uniref:GNAT family N-acetyltransferase n=1 Tax=Breznakiella homolactica TaxID=2798577 RepID=A0A7T8B9A0_9SPIR|nr:GNAT family N-acetyltransferase [Breznakiella homolactica]QQO07745.1 GNAT family N-acetyltransferase [Breznakiella homolactica]
MELQSKDFHKVESLIDGSNNFYPLMEAVVRRDIPGRIFVDSPDFFRTAMIINCLGWIYLIGADDSEVFDKEIIDVLREKTGGQYIWFGGTSKWRELAAACLSPDIQEHPRYRYRFNPEAFAAFSRALPPPALPVYRVDRNSIKRFAAKFDSVDNFWPGRETFLERGFAFYTEDAGNMVSMVMSASVVRGEAEIDIATDEAYQGRGLALQGARVYINHCLAAGLTPKWDCRKANIGSVKLAAKLGFEILGEYPLFFITLGTPKK